MNNSMEKEIFEIYIEDIIPNRFQPRLTFDEGALNELAESIKQHGIIQPLVLRKIEDKYEIIAGERRYKAAQIAGLKKVPAVIMNLDDGESAEIAVVENIQRRDLTALEEAESYKKLLDKGYLTQEQLANRMGKTQATISNKLRLLGLNDEVKEALLNQKISERHARSLLSLKNAEDQTNVLHKIIDNRLTVKQTDDLIKSMVSPTDPIPTEQIEALDFNDISIPPRESQIETPQSDREEIKNNPPIMPIPVTEVVPQMETKEEQINPLPEPTMPEFEPVSNIDIEKIKEQAQDINPIRETADVNALLGKSDEQQPEQTPPEPFKPVESARFIPFFNDEEEQVEEIGEQTQEATGVVPLEPLNVGFSNQENNTPPAVEETKTYTDSLINEFRQNSPQTVEVNEAAPNNLRSAINSVRETTENLKKNGFIIDSEEFDFENLYQIIIKINK